MITHHHNPCQASLPTAATGIPHLLPAKLSLNSRVEWPLQAKAQTIPLLAHLLEVHQISPFQAFKTLLSCEAMPSAYQCAEDSALGFFCLQHSGWRSKDSCAFLDQGRGDKSLKFKETLLNIQGKQRVFLLWWTMLILITGTTSHGVPYFFDKLFFDLRENRCLCMIACHQPEFYLQLCLLTQNSQWSILDVCFPLGIST